MDGTHAAPHGHHATRVTCLGQAGEAGDENQDRFLGLVASAASHHASETAGNNFEIQIQHEDGDPYQPNLPGCCATTTGLERL
jgi:hypothetical protein